MHAVTERSPHSPAAIRTLGVPTGYLPHASRAELLSHCGLISTGIAADCRTLLATPPGPAPAAALPAVTWSAP